MAERERIAKALDDVAHKIRATSLLGEYDARACKEAAALLRAEPVGIEKDDEGRPYQCGAFVSDDSRWECVRESDHDGEHDWRIRGDEPVGEPVAQTMDDDAATYCRTLIASEVHVVVAEPRAYEIADFILDALRRGGFKIVRPSAPTEGGEPSHEQDLEGLVYRVRHAVLDRSRKAEGRMFGEVKDAVEDFTDSILAALRARQQGGGA